MFLYLILDSHTAKEHPGKGRFGTVENILIFLRNNKIESNFIVTELFPFSSSFRTKSQHCSSCSHIDIGSNSGNSHTFLLHVQAESWLLPET
jgi:hypothetical protein